MIDTIRNWARWAGAGALAALGFAVAILKRQRDNARDEAEREGRRADQAEERADQREEIADADREGEQRTEGARREARDAEGRDRFEDGI